MASNWYLEQLKSPEWQKKRLEIFERDSWTCRYCGDTKTTLHVHHLTYAGKPWEAANDSLVTTCEHCHEAAGLLDGFEIIMTVKSWVNDSILDISILLKAGQHYAYFVCEIVKGQRGSLVYGAKISLLTDIIEKFKEKIPK